MHGAVINNVFAVIHLNNTTDIECIHAPYQKQMPMHMAHIVHIH